MFDYHKISVDLEKETMTLPNGCTLKSFEAGDIAEAYERMCTARYIKDQHPKYSESKAWELADKVRKLMDEYGYSEDTAVDIVIERRQAI